MFSSFEDITQPHDRLFPDLKFPRSTSTTFPQSHLQRHLVCFVTSVFGTLSNATNFPNLSPVMSMGCVCACIRLISVARHPQDLDSPFRNVSPGTSFSLPQSHLQCHKVPRFGVLLLSKYKTSHLPMRRPVKSIIAIETTHLLNNNKHLTRSGNGTI